MALVDQSPRLEREIHPVENKRIGLAIVWYHHNGVRNYQSTYATQDFIKENEIVWKDLELQAVMKYVAPDLNHYSKTKLDMKMRQVKARLAMIKCLTKIETRIVTCKKV